MLHDSVVVVVVAVVGTRPRAILLAMITTRRSTHGFPVLSYMSMGLRLVALRAAGAPLIGTLGKTRRQRQRERHQTSGLMMKTTAVHVRYNSWYISLPSSAKQQR